MRFHETHVIAWSYVTVDHLIQLSLVEDFQAEDLGSAYRLLST